MKVRFDEVGRDKVRVEDRERREKRRGMKKGGDEMRRDEKRRCYRASV